MGRKLVTILGTLGIVVLGGGLIALMGYLRPQLETAEPEMTPPTVFYAVAALQSVTLNVAAQGEVRPRTDISLTAQVSGRIVNVSGTFVNGGAFEEGDMLVKIEDADYRAAAAAAKARLAQSEEALRREEAEAALAREDYDDLGRDEAPSDLTLRIPQLAQARANYEASEADYRVAQINLERTVIRAPFKGRVRERIAGLGEFISPGGQLGRIFATDVAEIRLPLNDNDLAKLGLPLAFVESEEKPGPSVEMTAFIAGEQHTWRGRIARTEGAIDPTTRQVFAIAVVEDPYGAGSDDGAPLVMGLFVDAVIEGKPYANAIVLPRSALYGRDTVYVIGDDNRLRERTVNIVSADRDTVTVSRGVSPGDRIAASPLRGAEAGDEVTPADPNAALPNSADSAPAIAARGSGSGNGGDQP